MPRVAEHHWRISGKKNYISYNYVVYVTVPYMVKNDDHQKTLSLHPENKMAFIDTLTVVSFKTQYLCYTLRDTKHSRRLWPLFKSTHYLFITLLACSHRPLAYSLSITNLEDTIRVYYLSITLLMRSCCACISELRQANASNYSSWIFKFFFYTIIYLIIVQCCIDNIHFKICTSSYHN